MKTNQKQLILLEDNPVHEGLLGDYLEDSGFEVHRCHSIEDVRNVLDDLTPDILILDLVIDHDHTGVKKFAEEYRQSASENAPILFVTAHSKEFRNQVAHVENSDILIKPFTFEQVINSIRKIM